MYEYDLTLRDRLKDVGVAVGCVALFGACEVLFAVGAFRSHLKERGHSYVPQQLHSSEPTVFVGPQQSTGEQIYQDG